MKEHLYDAEGRRVAKGTIQLVNGQLSCDTTQNGFTPTASYILGPSGQQLTEMSWSGGTAQWSHTNVWVAGAGLIATYSADPDPSQGVAALLDFQFGDWLGTRRVLTDYTGNIEETCDSLTYGNGETCAPTPTEHLFTGKERDQESGNDYFGARYYGSSDDGSDQNSEDPQSWNLYAYVRDNPLINVDPDGHGCDTVTYSTISNQLIGIQPTYVRLRGSIIAGRNIQRRPEFDVHEWQLRKQLDAKSGIHLGQSAEEFITEFLNEIKAHASPIKQLSENHSVKISLVYHADTMPYIGLTKDQVQAIAELGAKLDYDLMIEQNGSSETGWWPGQKP